MHQAWHSSNDQSSSMQRETGAGCGRSRSPRGIPLNDPRGVCALARDDVTSSVMRTHSAPPIAIARQAIDRRVFVISAAAAADLHHGVRNHPLLLAHRNDEPPHRTIEQLFHVSCSFFVEAMAAAVTVNFDRLTFTSSSHCHLDFYRLRHCQGRSRRRTRLSHLHWIHLFRR